MKGILRQYVIVLAFGLTLAGFTLGWVGCSLIDDDSSSNSSFVNELVGTAWTLASFSSVDADGSPGDPVGLDTLAGRYTIDFLSDSTVAAQADCNDCGGYYRAESEDAFDVIISCTRAACNRSWEFSAAINTADRYEIAQRSLLYIFYTDPLSEKRRALIFKPLDDGDK